MTEKQIFGREKTKIKPKSEIVQKKLFATLKNALINWVDRVMAEKKEVQDLGEVFTEEQVVAPKVQPEFQQEESEEIKPGLFARAKVALLNWVDRTMAEQEQEQDFAEAQEEKPEAKSEAEKPKEESSQEEVSPDFYKIVDRKPSAWSANRRRAAADKVFREIRKASRANNYLNLSVGAEEAARIFFREERAIERSFEKHYKQLEKHYTPEEIWQLKAKAMEFAQTMDEIRCEGLDVRIGKIRRLQDLEGEMGGRDPQTLRFLDDLEIDFKAKQRVRGLDRKLAQEANLEVPRDEVWEPRRGAGMYKGEQRNLSSFWSKAVENKARTGGTPEQKKTSQEHVI